jgi:UDP-glucuronate 4-epimerase
VSIEEWCTYLGELTGVEPRFDPTEQTIDSVQIDTTRMHEVAGSTTVPWREGMHRMARALHPDKVA